jgi:predicted esterase
MASEQSRWTTAHCPLSREVPVRVRPGPEPGAPLIVMCHGMGENPASWTESWPRVLALPAHLVVPTAPYPFEIREAKGIRIGHAWYLYDGNEEPFRETVEASATWLSRMVTDLEEREGWEPRGRALIGHSQGAYFGYVAAFNHQTQFSHLVAVAGRLKTEFLHEALRGGGTLSTLILHGKHDRSVSPDAGHRSHEALTAAGFTSRLEFFPGGHRLTPRVDEQAADWLTSEGFSNP